MPAKQTTPRLPAQEFNERVRILRQYKEALARQRDRFRGYLVELEGRRPTGSIEDDLEFHVEMEHSIVKEIASFERTIEPLETLYRIHEPEGASDIPALRDALRRTRDEVLRRTSHNQALLRAQLEEIRNQVSSLRVVRGFSPVGGRSPARAPEPGLVNVTA
ncbi:MAG: flagellar biosynthesis protein FlgN [Spirochaetota bacterium]